MPEDRVLVQVRLPRELVKRLDHLAVDKDQTRQALVEDLLKIGLQVLTPQRQLQGAVSRTEKEVHEWRLQ